MMLLMMMMMTMTMRECRDCGVTLAADDLDSHARMSHPRRRVKFDVSRYERFVDVRVMHGE